MVYVYTYVYLSFLPLFSEYVFSYAHFISETPKGVDHKSDLVVIVVEVWARSVQCVPRGKSCQSGWALAQHVLAVVIYCQY